MRRLAQITGLGLVLAALVAHLPSFLTTSDPLPERADAIFVFAGDVPERPRCAAELYRRGVAPLLIFSGGLVRPELSALGSPASDAAVNARIAETLGVPAASEVVIPEGTSTWEDAGVLADWVRGSGARRVVAVTSPLHSRRARRTLAVALADTGAEISLVACGPRLGPNRAWWLDERGLVAVVNESLKLALYGARHFLPHALSAPRAPATPGVTPQQGP